jgi:subtilisin family serine protease
MPFFAINDVEPFGWQRVGVREAWSSLGGGRGSGTKVAVLGDGVDASHPDLAEAVAAIASFAGDQSPGPVATHAAGVIAAAENDMGAIGIAVESRLWSADVVGADGVGSMAALLAGLDWAVAEHVDIALAVPLAEMAGSAVCAAVARASQAGVLVIVPAGDVAPYAAGPAPNAMAACADALVVSAADDQDFAPPYAPFDDRVDVVAPGDWVTGPLPGAVWGTPSGTAPAAAYVAGAAALLYGRFPLLSAHAAADMLRRAADDIGDEGVDQFFGRGVLDIPGSLRMALRGWDM